MKIVLNNSHEERIAPANARLSSPGGELKCLGQFQANTSFKGQPYSFLVYVISGGGVNNMLSCVTAAVMLKAKN